MNEDRLSPYRAKLSPDQRESLVADYLAGMTAQQVADKHGVKQCSAWELLKRRGVSRTLSVAKRKYWLNENAFNEQSGDAAYWLGFLITDGSIGKSESSYILSLQLAEKDREHLEKFKAFLGADYPIRKILPRTGPKSFNSGIAYRVSLRCHGPMTIALMGAGVVPTKTKTAVASDTLATDPDFWRGCIDGDGSIAIRKHPTGSDCPVVTLCGASPVLLQQFSAFTKSVTPCRASISAGHHADAVNVSGVHAIRLLRAMYGGSGPRLERKGIAASAILARAAANPNWCNKRAPWTDRRRAACKS